MSRLVAAGSAVLMACAVATQSCAAGERPSEFASRLCHAGLDQLDRQAAANVSSKVYPGAVYLVAMNGATVHATTVGVSSLEQGAPMRQDTIFRLASMSKPITATAIMILVDEEKIRLDDPVSKYLPEFSHPKVGAPAAGDQTALPEAKRPITIREILTHTSGIEGDPAVTTAIVSTLDRRISLAERVRYYAQFPIAWEPGARFHYSALMGFDTLGRVVEVVSGQPFDRFLETRVLQPLGMKDTTFRLSPQQQERLVGIYDAKDGMFTPWPGALASYSYSSGAGGLFGTAGDYLRFAEMLAGHGARGGVRILTPKSADLMAFAQLDAGFPGLGPGTGWGLGMRRVEKDPFLPSGSFGWSGAYGTHFWIDPKHRLAAVLMINLSNALGAYAPTAREFERLVARSLSPTC